MTLPMIIALAVTVLMIILIMVDKLPFGAPPLLALLLLVVFGVTDIKTAFGGFANPTIVMLASFMAIIAALQKTSFIVKFKQTMFNMASKGGFKAYVLLILIVMLGCSLFGTGSTAYYVLVIGLLSTLPYSKQLPPSRVLMPAGFAANHPLLPFNTALQYGIVIAVLESAGVAANVNLVKFSLVNLCLSIGFLVWCILAYKILPDHPIAEAKEEALHAGEQKVALTKNQELITYFSFVLAVVGMILQSKIGDAGYAITGLAVGIILISGVMDFNEIRNSISAPIILMSAGVIGIADALGNTGLTSLVGETVAKMLGTNVNPFVLIFAARFQPGCTQGLIVPAQRLGMDYKGHIDQFMFQLLLDHTAPFFQDFQLKIRMSLEEICIQPGQQPASQDGRDSQPQSMAPSPQIPHDPGQLVRIFRQRTGHLQQPFSFRSQLHAPVLPDEQDHSEFPFQGLDGTGQRGLGHLQQFCCLGHVAAGTHRLEIAQLDQIHGSLQ